MKLKKRLLKITIWILVLAIATTFTTYYLKGLWKDFVTEKELTELITKIKYTEELPERFYELYEEAYPDLLSSSLNTQVLNGFISNDFVKSPSILASSISELSRKDTDSTRISNKKAYVLAWKLEEQTTQKECLNWALNNYKFDLNIHGISEVAQFYYGKNISQLNDKDFKDIIELMKTPSLVVVQDRSDEAMYQDE